MKAMKFILLFSFFWLTQFSVEARHLIGGNMTYTSLGNGDYQFTMNLFRDAFCTNCADFDNLAPIAIYQCNPDSNCQNLSQADPLFSFDVPLESVDFVLEASQYSCQDSLCQIENTVALEKGIYEFTLSDFGIVLPEIMESYFIVYQRCCLPTTISNLRNPDDQGFTTFAEITPEAQIAKNSMPISIGYRGVYVTCAKEPTVISLPVEDMEGDEIRYRMCSPITGGGNNLSGGTNNSCIGTSPDPACPPPYNDIQFALPFSPINPFQTESGFSIDFITGELSFTPTFIGNFMLAICVDEFRDGILLSSQNLTFQVVATAECEPIPTIDRNISQLIKLLPNPAQDHIQLELPETFQPDFFSIKNISGQEVRSGIYDISNRILLPNLPKGLYFLELHSAQYVAVKKFMIVGE